MEEYTESSTEIEAKLGDLKSRFVDNLPLRACEIIGGQVLLS